MDQNEGVFSDLALKGFNFHVKFDYFAINLVKKLSVAALKVKLSLAQSIYY